MSLIPETKIKVKDLSFTLRSAKESDAEQLLSLAKSILTEEDYSVTTPHEFNNTVEQQIQWIQKLSSAPDKVLIVAVFNDRIVGMVDFSAYNKARQKHHGVFGISIDREFRGKGIGRVLMNALLEWARKNPLIEKVGLTVHAENKNAIFLYQSLGFKQEGLIKNNLKYSDDDYRDTVIMGIDTR